MHRTDEFKQKMRAYGSLYVEYYFVNDSGFL